MPATTNEAHLMANPPLEDLDPRDLLMEGHVNIRPTVLEEWFWQVRLSSTAQRVYWFHWDACLQKGTWLSTAPLKVVAAACRRNSSTITRAYQELIALGLVHRTSTERIPTNPFRQTTPVTEVLLPQEVCAVLLEDAWVQQELSSNRNFLPRSSTHTDRPIHKPAPTRLDT